MGTDLPPARKAEFFDQLLETTPHDLIWMFSPDWEELVFLSQGYERLWGRSRATLEDDPRDFLKGIHPEDRAAVRDAMDRVSAGETVDIEFRITPAEDRVRWIQAHGEPIRDEAGEIFRVAGFVREVTTEKQRAQQLQRQNERLEEFAGVVSHDLGNPLSVAHGRLALAQEECDSEHLAEADRAVDRSLTLIDDLLVLARSGERVDEVEAVELAELVERCWTTVETGAATLEVETNQVVEADSGQLRQLLENLFGNAVDHGGEAVMVTIGDRADGFYVADDGSGIPERERTEVFEPGYSTAAEGTGFGLNIVREIAEAHEWEVAVTESAAGGARFEFSGVTLSTDDE